MTGTSTKITPRTLKGFRDFLPDVMYIRNFVKGKFKEVFEKFGFEPLETPVLEYQDILLGKYGDEADKLVYTFTDRGGRKVAMRYDLTVPTARVVSQYANKLPMPFKRYQMQRVWRADKPQKGRYREFEQCDIDIYGSTSSLSDAEIIAVIYHSLKSINLPNFTIRVNNRVILQNLIIKAGVPENLINSTIRILDKLDKKSVAEVQDELVQLGIDPAVVQNLFELIDRAKPNKELDEVLNYLGDFGVSSSSIQFDPTLARGLDYYTGMIFEVVVKKPKIGSISGGGRYDNLIGMFTGKSTPAVGGALGLDRIIDSAIENNLLNLDLNFGVQVMFVNFGGSMVRHSLKYLRQLQDKGINCMIFPDSVDIRKQFKYANSKKIPFVITIGENELSSKKIAIKDMNTRSQYLVNCDNNIEEVVDIVRGEK